MATRKFAILIVSVVLLLLAVLFVGIFPLTTSRVFLNQRRAMRSLMDLNQAQRRYAATHPKAGFACNLSDLAAGGPWPGSSAGLIDRVLAAGVKSYYAFAIHCQRSVDRATVGYSITAVPVERGVTGDYALCTDQEGAVWYSENGSPSDCLAKRRPMPLEYR